MTEIGRYEDRKGNCCKESKAAEGSEGNALLQHRELGLTAEAQGRRARHDGASSRRFVSPTLDVLAFAITWACNLRCSFCSRDAGRERESLSLDDINAALDSIKQLPKPRVIVISGGEPTMHPRFFDILDAVVGRAEIVRINTNGTTLTSSIVGRLKRSGIGSAGVSIDGANPDVHDSLRGIKGSFGRTMRGIGLLRENGIAFSFKTTLGESNKGELPGIIELASAEGAASVGVSRTVPIGRASSGFKLIAWNDYARTLKEGMARAADLGMRLIIDDPLMMLIDDKMRALAKKREGSGIWAGCAAGVTMANVLPNKDVIPCPAFPIVLGNLDRDDLRTIWFSEKANSLRTRDTLKGKCGACSLKNLCGGCRGMAYATTNDPLAEDPFCPMSMPS